MSIIMENRKDELMDFYKEYQQNELYKNLYDGSMKLYEKYTTLFYDFYQEEDYGDSLVQTLKKFGHEIDSNDNIRKVLENVILKTKVETLKMFNKAIKILPENNVIQYYKMDNIKHRMKVLMEDEQFKIDLDLLQEQETPGELHPDR